MTGLDDLVTPTAFALSQVCQVAVGILLNGGDCGWPDLDEIAGLFGQVPAPRTYADALQSAALFIRFLQRTTIEIHKRIHGGTIPASCLFDSTGCVAISAVDQIHPERWNASEVFAAWSAEFTGVFATHHRESVADRAILRLRARIGVVTNASDVARAVGCSVPVLNRTLRRTTGQSLRGYAIKLRVERAIQLLRQTDWKVEVISREVGWKSKKDLYVAFGRYVGATPTFVRRHGVTATEQRQHMKKPLAK